MREWENTNVRARQFLPDDRAGLTERYGDMTIWISNVPIRGNVFRYFDPPSGTWIELVGADDQWTVIARLYDSQGDRFSIDDVVTPGARFHREQAGAFVTLTPLPAGQRQHPKEALTGEADFLLEMSSYNGSGGRVFEIKKEKFRAKKGQPTWVFDDPSNPRVPRPKGMLE